MNVSRSPRFMFFSINVAVYREPRLNSRCFSICLKIDGSFSPRRAHTCLCFSLGVYLRGKKHISAHVITRSRARDWYGRVAYGVCFSIKNFSRWGRNSRLVIYLLFASSLVSSAGFWDALVSSSTQTVWEVLQTRIIQLSLITEWHIYILPDPRAPFYNSCHVVKWHAMRFRHVGEDFTWVKLLIN